nr:hypothetical protein [Tanacetum cinerariifolium]
MATKYWRTDPKTGSIKTPSDVELIENKKAFIEDLKKKVVEEDLDEFEITKIGKMMKRTQEDLDELMNKDEPKMKKKIEPKNPLMAMRRARSMQMKKLIAEEDLDEFEITKIGKMVKKTQEDLDESGKKEDAPKMKKKRR